MLTTLIKVQPHWSVTHGAWSLTPPVTHSPTDGHLPHLVPQRCKDFTLWSSSHCCRSSSVSNEIPSSPSSRLPEGHVASQSIQPQLIPSGDQQTCKATQLQKHSFAQPHQMSDPAFLPPTHTLPYLDPSTGVG